MSAPSFVSKGMAISMALCGFTVTLAATSSLEAQAVCAITQITDTTGDSGGPLLDANIGGVGPRGEQIGIISDRDLVPAGNLDANYEVFVYDIAGASFAQITCPSSKLIRRGINTLRREAQAYAQLGG